MAKAYVRVCIEPGYEVKLKEKLSKEKGVLSAEITAGEQDMIVLVEANSYEEILNFVLTKIRKEQGVKITWTNFILNI